MVRNVLGDAGMAGPTTHLVADKEGAPEDGVEAAAVTGGKLRYAIFA